MVTDVFKKAVLWQRTCTMPMYVSKFTAASRGSPCDSTAVVYIYGWLVKIYGCFSAKPENCGEGIFCLKISAVYQIYG